MVDPLLPVSLLTQSTASPASSSSPDPRTKVSSTDFMKILIAQMSSPDLSSLFGSNSNDQSSSIFGSSTNSLFGSDTSLLTQALGGQSTSGIGLPTIPQMELTVWSNLIGKTVDYLDPATGAAASGAVKSVVLENDATMLDLGDRTIKPSIITKVS
ncbi:MAG: hypothetical protein NTZ10_02460 [Candidatus Saganbacteria bacterium]|nr:hypothetical protein [Candidatus Saganbacteria bacterium]